MLTSATGTPLLEADFKKPGKKDLFIAAPLECDLFTGTSLDAFADASVDIRLFVDGTPTRPAIVHYCGKTNGLIPPFLGLATCTQARSVVAGFRAVIWQKSSAISVISTFY